MNNYKLWYKVSVITAAILIALVVGALIILAVGGSVFETYWIIIS